MTGFSYIFIALIVSLENGKFTSLVPGEEMTGENIFLHKLMWLNSM